MSKYFVFDTTTLLSASLFKNTNPRFSVNSAIRKGKLAIFKETLAEFMDVVNRKKFDKYFFSVEERLEFFNEIEEFFELFFTTESITDCRDPKDNKFLELAFSAKANCLITGDDDLLVLHPYRGIPILNAADFLDKFLMPQIH
jgi:uncharacterized protein